MSSKKVDSNLTGLRYAEEESVGVLPADPVWHGLEPNSYKDMGAEITTMARTPITAGRQRKKGVVVDLEASAGFSHDFTQEGFYDLLQGFFFADWRKTPNGAVSAVTAAGEVTVAGGAGIGVGRLVLLKGLGLRANNGLVRVTASDAGALTVTGKALADEAAPPQGALARVVGVQFDADDASLVVNAGEPGLATVTLDLTTLGLVPGSWVHLGGDAIATRAGYVGWARVKSVTAHLVTFDKTESAFAADAASGKTVQLFFGDTLKNESDPALIKQHSYQFERSLSSAGYEYVKGSVANELKIAMSTADKVTVELDYISTDAETVDDPDAPKEGSRPAIPKQDAFNTSSNIARMHVSGTGGSTLAAYFTEFELTVKNGVDPAKAIGVLGAFDITAGDFEVDGTLTGYFTTVDAIAAVRNNEDASLELIMAQNNAGWAFDVPLVGLGGGRLNVEKNKPVMIPLEAAGAESEFGHTLLANCFHYLPDVAS